MGGRRRELVSESRAEALRHRVPSTSLACRGTESLLRQITDMASFSAMPSKSDDESHHKHISTSAARSSLPRRGPTRAAAFPFPAAVIEAAQLASKYPLAVSWSIATQAQLAMLRFISGG